MCSIWSRDDKYQASDDETEYKHKPIKLILLDFWQRRLDVSIYKSHLIYSNTNNAQVETLNLDSESSLTKTSSTHKNITNEHSFAFQTPLPNPEYITVKTIHKDV